MDLDQPTSEPVAPFTTGFRNETADSLGALLKQHIDYTTKPETTAVYNATFGVLDPRSVDDQAMLPAHWDVWWPGDPENEIRDDVAVAGRREGWRTLRVRVQDALQSVVMLEMTPQCYFAPEAQVEFDEKGVLKDSYVEENRKRDRERSQQAPAAYREDL